MMITFMRFEGSDKLEGEGYPMEWWSKTHNRRTNW